MILTILLALIILVTVMWVKVEAKTNNAYYHLGWGDGFREGLEKGKYTQFSFEYPGETIVNLQDFYKEVYDNQTGKKKVKDITQAYDLTEDVLRKLAQKTPEEQRYVISQYKK